MQTVFNKLFKNNKPKKVGLKKVELNSQLLSDIDDLIDQVEMGSSEASYYANERFEELEDEFHDFRMKLSEEVDNMAINGVARMLDENSENLQKKLKEFKAKVEELGLDTSDITVGYGNYTLDEAEQFAVESYDLFFDFKDKYKEFTYQVGLGDFIN